MCRLRIGAQVALLSALTVILAGSPLVAATGTPAISAGGYHSAALQSDGTLWTWGNNDLGQLGDGTSVGKAIPTQIGTDSTWVKVAAGYAQTLALKSNGTLWAWGSNTLGTLGDGTGIGRNSPTQVGSESNWTAVSTGGLHSAALKGDGTLWAWGDNAQGEVGDGTNFNRYAPVQVGVDSDWVAVATGEVHTIALKSNGTLWAWGNNGHGQLGDGTSTTRYSPVQIGTESNWVSISSGLMHNMGLKSDGTVWAWGMNSNGELGLGTTSFAEYTPIQVGSDTDWVGATSGAYANHTMAEKSNGTLWAWGGNWYGQLGDGTTTTVSSPIQITADTNWVSVAVGGNFTVALKSDGSLYAWGGNAYSQLGDNTTTDRHSPVWINLHAVNASAGANGSISPSGVTAVNHSYTQSFVVTPSTGYHIAAVSGCDGTLDGATYTTGTVTADCSVTVTFAIDTHTLDVSKSGTGGGTVTSTPAGISCGSSCSAVYDYGTSVSLSASPGSDSVFVGWGGACSGSGACVVSLVNETSVTASFFQGITVTVPNGGETWRRNTTYTIRWNYTGNPGASVKIVLLKGGVVNRTIANSAPRGSNGVGSYNWRVPGNQILSSDYKIRITSTSLTNFTDVSDANFTISQ